MICLNARCTLLSDRFTLRFWQMAAIDTWDRRPKGYAVSEELVVPFTRPEQARISQRLNAFSMAGHDTGVTLHLEHDLFQDLFQDLF